jgi:hypothetical protein
MRQLCSGKSAPSTYVIFFILEETLFTNKKNRSECFATAMFPPNDRYAIKLSEKNVNTGENKPI